MPVQASDAARVTCPPPLVFGGAVLGGVLLQAFIVPLPFLAAAVIFRIATATLLALAGLSLLGGAWTWFRRTGQDPKPWTTPPALVTRGVYRWSRNPMYVGLALLQAALGFVLANGWIVLLVPGVLWIVYVIAIRPEEVYLERKFGTSYLSYKSSVRRWL